MAKATASRRRVGQPLTPSLLKKMAVFKHLSPPDETFDAAGDWTGTYRIWACHGFLRNGNNDFGFLRIDRRIENLDETFTLEITQHLHQAQGMTHIIKAEVECRADALATPLKWYLSSRFVSIDEESPDDLAAEETVRVDESGLDIETAGHKLRRPLKRPFTGDWNLFEAIQRLPFPSGNTPSFTVLEGLSLPKEGHHLTYRGSEPLDDPVCPRLHRFTQLGQATLPYDYWLDEQHRLQVAITMSRAYILDDRAEEIARRFQTSQQQSYRKAKQRSRGGIK